MPVFRNLLLINSSTLYPHQKAAVPHQVSRIFESIIANQHQGFARSSPKDQDQDQPLPPQLAGRHLQQILYHQPASMITRGSF